MKNPEFRVDCITHRKDPILLFCCLTMCLDEDDTIMNTTIESELMITCKESGINFTDITQGPDNPNFTFGAPRNPEDLGEVTRLAEEFYAHKLASYFHWLLLCNPEINIDNPDRAFREFALNTDPRKDFHVTDMDAFNNPLIFDTPFEERSKNINQSKVWIDATTGRKPKEQKLKCSDFESAFPETVREKAKEKWAQLGFDRPFEEIEPVDPDWIFKN